MTSVTHVGLDVHLESTAVAILRPRAVEPESLVVPSSPEAYRKLFARLPRERTVACYEAGPCGYEPYRILTGLGVRCDVIAPALIPRRPGKHVKTDRLDACNLSRLHRAGELVAIRVPSPAEEAIRDLVRVREALKDDRRRALQRIRSYLIRYGKRFPGKTSGWSQRFENWIGSVTLEEPHAQRALDHLRAAAHARHAQLVAIDSEIEELSTKDPLADAVGKLRCFRGIDTLSAATLASEVCDFRQFPNAPAFMGFTGLVPSEHSSGDRQRRGSITKAGNHHLRRILVEAAWHYQHRPAVGLHLRRRQQGQPPELIAHCWAAQHRLHTKFCRIARTRPSQVAVTAVARELAGFIWGVMNARYAS